MKHDALSAGWRNRGNAAALFTDASKLQAYKLLPPNYCMQYINICSLAFWDFLLPVPGPFEYEFAQM